MTNILIRNCVIIPMEKETADPGERYFVGEIAVSGRQIVHVGLPGTVGSDFQPEQIIDGTGKVALPGLINGHTHAAMTLFRGYADDLPLMQWLEQRIWPLEANLTPEDVYWGTKLSILEMLKAGITTFADMYFFMDQVAQAVRESGMRASLARGIVGGERGLETIRETEELAAKWHGFEDGRITVMFGPHAPYTCPPEFLKEVISRAKKSELGIHIHLAETLDEVQRIKEQNGKTPVELMESIGLFEVPVAAAHCVHLAPHEIKILRDYNVKVVHNPESNMKLASGIAPVPEMLEAGVTVALGTDGAASNNNLDLFGEMRAAALLHKVNKMDSTVISAYQALQMATKAGAQALGLKDVGILKAGYKADLILVDLEKPHLYPRHDVVAHLVYAVQAADVDLVMVDGRILVEKGQLLTLDEEEIYRKVTEAAGRLTGQH